MTASSGRAGAGRSGYAIGHFDLVRILDQLGERGGIRSCSTA
jgi:hypothetical protein